MKSRFWRSGLLSSLLALLFTTWPAQAGANDWMQFDLNPQHSGDATQEIAISAANVAMLHRIVHVALPSIADGAPAYLSDVSTTGGAQDLLFLTTKDGHILALNAESGATVWSHQYGPGTCHINNGSNICYTTSSPAVDPDRQYVYSYGLDGSVHKYAVGDGAEVTTGGWPERTTLKAFDEKGSSALSIATDKSGASYLYVTNGGYPGDNGDYQGHVTAINLATGSQNVFNAVCSDQTIHFVEQPGNPDCPTVQSAIWARAGVVYDPDTNTIYMATGNGDFDPTNDYWGDSVLALHPDGTGSGGRPLDSYTPTNFQSLQNGDTDLGSTAPALLPAPATSTYKHLAVQSGKDGEVRLLNLDNLSNQGGSAGPGRTGGEIQLLGVPQGGEVLTAPAVWVNPSDATTWVFVANDNGISGLQLTVNSQGMPGLHPVWQIAGQATSPIVANSLLFVAGSNSIQALDPTAGHQLWHDTGIGGIHWESPIVCNGILYITDESRFLSAYALPTQTAPVPAQMGWSLIDLPLVPFGSLPASVFLRALLTSSGGTLAAIYGLSHGQWTPSLIAHGTTQTGSDFTLQAGQSYLVYSAQAGSPLETGTVPASAPTWSLGVGWNLVGDPVSAPQASALLNALLKKSGGTLAAIYSLSGGTWTPSLIEDGTTQIGGDFPLHTDQGYLLYTDTATTFDPGTVALAGRASTRAPRFRSPR